MTIRAEWLCAGAEIGVRLGMEGWERGLMGWEDTRTPGGLLEGLTGGWGGVILLMRTQGWCEVMYPGCLLEGLAGGWGYRDEHFCTAA